MVKKPKDKIKKKTILDHKASGEIKLIKIAKNTQLMVENTKYFLFMEGFDFLRFFGFDFVDNFN